MFKLSKGIKYVLFIVLILFFSITLFSYFNIGR